MAKRKTAQYVAAVERNRRRYHSEEEKRKREEREAKSIAKEERRRIKSQLRSIRKIIKADIAKYEGELYQSFSEYKFETISMIITLFEMRDWVQTYYNIWTNYEDFQSAFDLLINSNYQGIKEPSLNIDTRSESIAAYESIKYILQLKNPIESDKIDAVTNMEI